MRRIFLSCLFIGICLSLTAENTFVETFSSSSLLHKIVFSGSNPSTPQIFTGDNGVSWEYWLGGGNHECFGANDSCMYIRARRSNETCEYGYLMTAEPIFGGISSLSLQWKQGGAESGINYDVVILINDSIVGRIQQAGLSEYVAADAEPFTYSLTNLNISGDFTLKIENRTPYDGTSNKGRFVFDNLTWTIMSDSIVPSVYGYVLDQNKQPVVGAVMSDGFSVVQTDSRGYYSFETNVLSEFVFVSVPSGYDIPLDQLGAPKMYAAINTIGAQRRDFTLNRQADGGKADSTHVMLAISDPQVLNNYDLWRYTKESVVDMRNLISSYPAGTKIYASIVGDIVWDWYNAFSSQKSVMASLGIPCFMTIGNHDHQASHACVEATETVNQDRVADDLFTAAFGPHYYSWNIGAIHYISVDNVLYTGCGGDKSYSGAITQEQIDWLKKDVALLPSGTPIVIFCHIPMYNEQGSLDAIKASINKGNVVQYIISGHTHTPYIHKHSARLWEHNLGAAEGAFWASNWCADGAPNGYEVLQAGPTGYTDFYYKSTGYDRDYQFRTYAPGSIDAGNKKSNCVLANVWFYDEKWSVNIYENGEKHVMRQFTGLDPKAYDVLLGDGDTRPNYPGSDGGTIASKNPGAGASKQMFYYQPVDPNAEFIVEVTDRFGNVYRQPVLRNMMAATFTQKGDAWVYEQDFNSLPSYPNHFNSSTQLAKGTFVQGHYPLGWYVSTSGTGSAYTTFNYYRISNGSLTDGGLYSFGAGDPTKATANSTERSLGLLPSSSQKSLAAGVLLENNTDMEITSLDIKYVGKIWRTGSAAQQQTLKFAYVTNPDEQALRERTKWVGSINMHSASNLDFTTPEGISVLKKAIDGDAAANQTMVSGTIDNLHIMPGETVMLRWTNEYNGGQEQGMAIDDLVIRASGQTVGLVEVGTDVNLDVRKTIVNGQLVINRGNHAYTALGQIIE